MLSSQRTQSRTSGIEHLALENYRGHLGKISLVSRLCIALESGETYQWLSRPAKIVVCETPEEKVVRWDCKDMLSSTWNVELLEPHPDVPPGAALSIHGNAYTVRGNVFRGDFDANRCRARHASMSEFIWKMAPLARAMIVPFRYLTRST